VARVDSPSNPRIAEAVRQLRDGTLFPLEGPRITAEALDAGIRTGEAFYLRGSVEDALLTRLEEAGSTLQEVSPRVLTRLSDLPSTRGLVVLAPPPLTSLDDLLLPSSGLAVILDEVQDPANVGVMLRSAAAFGAGAAVLTAGCARPFSARAFRASAGGALRLPIAAGVTPEEALDWARSRGAVLVGAEAHGGESPERTASRRPLALVIGSEGHGISAVLQTALDVRVTIPLRPGVESLNAGVALGVLLYVLSSKVSASKR